jgi:hypothetical protein
MPVCKRPRDFERPSAQGSKISTPVERLAKRRCACVRILEFKGWAAGISRSGAMRAWIPSTDDISMI